jgi:hypothetical protein
MKYKTKTRQVAERARDTNGAIWLLTVLLSDVHSFGQKHHIRYYIHLPTVERFSDVTKITKLTESLNETKLSKKQAIAVREFRSALKRRAEGKPDDAWRSDNIDAEVKD